MLKLEYMCDCVCAFCWVESTIICELAVCVHAYTHYTQVIETPLPCMFGQGFFFVTQENYSENNHSVSVCGGDSNR